MEAFDVAVLHRSPRLDVDQTDLPVLGPAQHPPRSKLRPIVRAHVLRAAVIRDQPFQNACHPSRAKAGIRLQRQALPRVISRAELSLVVSKIAVDRASKADAKEFAGFELAEAIAVTTVLKDLGTPVPTMTAKAKATLEKIDNRVELRELTQAYLGHPAPPKSNMEEGQGRHLGTLSLAVFKEHVMITHRILSELQAGA